MSPLESLLCSERQKRKGSQFWRRIDNKKVHRAKLDCEGIQTEPEKITDWLSQENEIQTKESTDKKGTKKTDLCNNYANFAPVTASTETRRHPYFPREHRSSGRQDSHAIEGKETRRSVTREENCKTTKARLWRRLQAFPSFLSPTSLSCVSCPSVGVMFIFSLMMYTSLLVWLQLLSSSHPFRFRQIQEEGKTFMQKGFILPFDESIAK